MFHEPLSVLSSVSLVIHALSVDEKDYVSGPKERAEEFARFLSSNQTLPFDEEPKVIECAPWGGLGSLEDKHVVLMLPNSRELEEEALDKVEYIRSLTDAGAKVTLVQAQGSGDTYNPIFIPLIKVSAIEHLDSIRLDVEEADAKQDQYITDLIEERKYQLNTPSYIHATNMQQMHNGYFNSLVMLYRNMLTEFRGNIRRFPVTAKVE